MSTDLATLNPRPTDALTIVRWSRARRGSRVGFASVLIKPYRLILHNLVVGTSHGKAWISFPASPMVDAERQVVRDDSGKVRYTPPLVEWSDTGFKERFEGAVLAAVMDLDPDAFEDEAA